MYKCTIVFAVICMIQGTLAVPLHDGQFEIHDGNCTKAVVTDLVFQKHVHLSRIPFTQREDSVSLCLILLTNKNICNISDLYI